MTKKIEVFASEALPGELEDFPDIKRGWGTTKESTGGIPPMKWFNAIQKRTDEAINNIANNTLGGYSFKDGATLDSENDFIYDDNSNSWYFWRGEFPKSVPSGSLPSDSDWVSIGGKLAYSFSSESIERSVYSVLRETCSILDFVDVADGIIDNTEGFIKACESGLPIYIPYGCKVKITQWSNKCVGIYGQGEIISSVNESISHVMPEFFFIDGITFSSNEKYGLSLSGDNLSIRNILVRYVGDKEVKTRYNPLQFNNCNNLTLFNFRYIDSGLRLLSCKNARIDNFYINVNRIGEGIGAHTDGTDGIKGSRGTTGNITNGIIENASRDGIDFYTSGKELNFSNIKINNSFFHGVEIKTYNRDISDDYPYHLNFNNIQVKNTGKGEHISECAGFYLWSESQEANSPLGVNISNFIIDDVGNPNSTTGGYYGVLLQGVKQFTASNLSVNKVEHGNISSVDIGLRMVDCDSLHFNNCTIAGKDRAIQLIRGSNTWFNSCKIGESEKQKSNYGLYISGVNSNLSFVGNCLINGVTKSIESAGAVLSGLRFSSSFNGNVSAGEMNNAVFYGCKFSVLRPSDIGLSINKTSTMVSVISCCFDGVGDTAINVKSTTGANISGNFFSGFKKSYVDSGGNNSIILTDNIRNSSVAEFNSPSGDRSISKDNIPM